ncbi:MAG: F0F1 ATP synthase subunit A [Clostridia bacterium]|nr:F0F1 ATP synthase subunit A [Clostridia bacterium]
MQAVHLRQTEKKGSDAALKEKKARSRGLTWFITVWIALIVCITAAVFVVGFGGGEEDLREAMRDGVLHEKNRISILGLEVNPGLVSAYIVTSVLLLAALLIRIFAVPRFRTVPGKFQSLIEKAVDFFSDMAAGNSPHRTGFVAAYIFSAGLYVFFSTLFELFGVQVITTSGRSVSLPAPLADINGALGMGFLSFAVILAAGIFSNGPKGALRVLKDFSLPISMSFRLFGALLSGLLVTELVYHYAFLSFGLPVIVGVLFTLLHAVIQTYVLCTLVSIFYGEAVEPAKKKKKKTDGPSAPDENGAE